jgi:hypothetical protein
MQDFPTVKWVRAEMAKRAEALEKAREQRLEPFVTATLNELAKKLRETLAFPVQGIVDTSLPDKDAEFVSGKVYWALDELGYDVRFRNVPDKERGVVIYGFADEASEDEEDE